MKNFNREKMWDIDQKLQVGDVVTEMQKEYFNRYFDMMVSEINEDADHWN